MKNLIGFSVYIFLIFSFSQKSIAQCTSISGTVFTDYNENGVFDGSPREAGIANVGVTAYDDAGTSYGPVFTDANGQYTLNALPNTPLRIEFDETTLPNAFSVWAADANIPAATQIVNEAADGCIINLASYCRFDYIQDNIDMATACYINGDPLLGGDAGTADALVSFPYTASGQAMGGGTALDHDAFTNQIGAVWGLAWHTKTQTLYAAAFVKRHSGLGPLGTGGIYAIDYSNPASPSVSNWLDVNTLAGVNTGADPHSGLPADKNDSNHDGTAFDAVGKIGLGDIDIDEVNDILYAVNLNDKSLLKIDLNTKNLVEPPIAIPNPNCTDHSSVVEKALNFGVADAAGTFSGFESGLPYVTAGSGWQSDYVQNLQPNNTSAPYMLFSGVQFGDPVQVSVPISNGTYEVSLYFSEYGGNTVGDRVFDIILEGTTVEANYDIAADVGVEVPVEKIYSVTVSDGNLNLDLNRQSGFNALIRGMKISIPTNTPNIANNDHQPWALKVKKDAVYVGVVCSGQTSGMRDDISATIYKYDGSSFNNEVSFPLYYDRGRAYNFGDIVSNIHEFYPWINELADVPTEAHSDESGNLYLQYPQAIVGDIEFDEQGNMIVSLIDRFGHQMGWANWGDVGGDTNNYHGQTSGDLLKFCYDGTNYIKEGDAACNIQTHTNLDGSTEFFLDEIIFPSAANPTHEEINMGGTAVILGSSEVASIVTDPLDRRSAGLRWWNSDNGNRIRDYEIIPDDLSTGTFGKAAGLGDLELLKAKAPIEVGNYVWFDADEDGTQDPSEAALANVTVELYDASATLVGSATTDANGRYYFGGETNVNMIAANTILYNSNYEIRIALASAQTNDGSITDELEVTSTDNDADNRDNDGTLDGTNTYATYSFTTDEMGENIHHYDFGFKSAFSCPATKCMRVTLTKN